MFPPDHAGADALDKQNIESELERASAEALTVLYSTASTKFMV
jgi:hypothetical protein